MSLVLRDLGSRATGTAGTSTTLTLTGAVTPHEAVVLFLGTNNTTATITGVTDDAGGGTNAYVVDRTITSSNRRGYVVRCTDSKALAVGTTLTITFSASVAAKAMRAVALGGFAASPLDVGADAAGSSTTPSSGATATTAQATGIALGLLVTDGVTADAFTIGGGYTSLTGVFNTTTANVAIYPAYLDLGATGAQTYSATITSRAWTCGVVVYKAWNATPGLRVAASVGAEVAYVVAGGRSAGFVGAEVAYAVAHAAASFVGAEVAYVPVVTASMVRVGPRLLALGVGAGAFPEESSLVAQGLGESRAPT